MRKIFFLIVLLLSVVIPIPAARAESLPAAFPPAARTQQDPYSMIAEVNALRAANGLPAYSASPILMTIAQQHAEFMAANGTGHIGYGGTRPYQRALNAGYPLAGDLSLGGFISENITAGNNKTVQQAVIEWQGDAPHLNTMLSPNLTEIGAGVAFVGEKVYYVIDCARPTGSGQQQVYVPPAGSTQAAGAAAPPVVNVAPLASTIVPSTAEPDGRLYHVVRPGETLWLIAISYGVKVADIRRLNGMAEADAIYPNEKLLIVDSLTPVSPSVSETPTTEGAPSLTPTLTAGPTLTPVPTWTPVPTLTPLPPTPVPSLPVSPDSGVLVLGGIIFAALILAGILVRTGRHG